LRNNINDRNDNTSNQTFFRNKIIQKHDGASIGKPGGILAEFEKAMQSLQLACNRVKTPFEINSAIQRFEFTYKLFWKTLQAFLFPKGVIAKSPRDIVREAIRLGILADEMEYTQLIAGNNRDAKHFDPKHSGEIFGRIKFQYLKTMQTALLDLKQYVEPRDQPNK
jgi:nucleotidyltransferase substrate binding protein (TIGR01987 family)